MISEENKLKKRRDFTKVYRNGHSIVGSYLVLCFKKNNRANFRVGFTVSKKVGNAVVRNLVRRRLKEIVRLNINIFHNGYDYVFVARKTAPNVDYHQLEYNLLSLVARVEVK